MVVIDEIPCLFVCLFVWVDFDLWFGLGWLVGWLAYLALCFYFTPFQTLVSHLILSWSVSVYVLCFGGRGGFYLFTLPWSKLGALYVFIYLYLPSS